MKEFKLRKWHRRMGVALALFIILQAGTGFLISINELDTPHSHAHTDTMESQGHDSEKESLWHETLELIHHGASTFGALYRILVGAGTVVMAVSGIAIFFKMKARYKEGQR